MKNDWIIANINNPDFTASDFKDIGGFTLENTELLSKEDYLKSDKILQNPLFQNDKGEFSNSKFEDYYNNQAQKFSTFQQDSSLDNYEYGFWDVFQKPTSRVRNPNFNIEKVANPTHQSTGVVGINLQGERAKSDFELAEKQQIYDWKSGKFLNESPEDSALFTNPFKFIENIFSEPLVLAKYEEDVDEINPLTGMLEHHKKGDNKINSNGEYYFETLGGRSLMGKQVLSIGDVITKEDSAVNKYDFFDSDDMEKSPTGVIARNLAAVAPMLFLGPTGASLYSGFFVAREVLKTLPMLYEIGTILSDNSEDSSMLNTLAAYGQKFTGGTSEAGKTSTFSFENFGNLVSDVALQWGQQKFIAEKISKLMSGNKSMLQAAEGKAALEYEKYANGVLNQAYQGKLDIQQAIELTGAKSLDDIGSLLSTGKWQNTFMGNKALEKSLNGIRDVYSKRQKLGQDLSLVYMSMISNTDVYESAIEHGATKQEAALVALGSMAGMFYVDKYLGLGEMFFDDEQAAARRAYRKLLKDHYDQDVAPVISSLAAKAEKEEEKKGLMQFFKLGKDKTIEFLKDYHSDIKDRALGIVGKSIGEGLEEASEELVTDITKGLYQVAGQFGWVSQKDIGAWENMEDRYLMSLLGGAVGGALFGGIESLRNPKTVSDKNSRDALLTTIRQEGSSGILKELERMKDEGKLGSKDLSVNTQEITTADGTKEVVFLNANQENISQNDFNYNQMKNAIQQMDAIINGNQLNISDEKLFERMITSDMKLEALKEQLKDASYISGYYQDFQKLIGDIYENEVAIEKLQQSADPTKRTPQYEEELKKLLDKKAELQKRKEDFFTNKTQRYLKKTIFAINPSLSEFFIPPTFESYVQRNYKKPVQYLSENELSEAKQKYDEWVKTRKVEELDEAFDSFEKMTDKIIPVLQEYSESDVSAWEKVRKELANNFPNFEFKPNYDTRIVAKQVNIEEKLKTLKVIKGEEYDKPWNEDPTKTNKAFDLQLEEDPSMFFQIVKDQEDNNWSIHFKTENPDPRGPRSILTENQKNRLFEAAATVIPEGDNISTWGSITMGGISGLNRFGQMGGFKRIGERTISLKAGQKQVQIEFDESQVPSLEEIKASGSKEVRFSILRTKKGKSHDLRLVYEVDGDKITITPHGSKDAFLISKSLLPEESSLRETSADPDFDFENLSNFGKIVKIYSNDGKKWITEVEFSPKSEDADGTVTEYFQGLLAPELVPQELRGEAESSLTFGTTYNAEEEIQVPIFQKQTSETDEEYENRNTQLEDETEEEFEQRKKLRIQQLQNQYIDTLIDSIQNLINSNAVIDPNTFRYIMANMGYRIKDIVKAYVNLIDPKEVPIKNKIQDILNTLNEDLSNVEDVWKQIQSKVIEYTNDIFSQAYPNLPKISKYNGLKNHSGVHIIQDLVEYISTITNDIIDLDNFEDLPEEINSLLEELGEYEFNVIIDKINISRAEGKPIKLYNDYTIILDNGEIVTINSNTEISDPVELAKIRENLEENYPPEYAVGYSEEQYNKSYQQNESIVKNNFDAVIGQLSRDSRYTTLLSLKSKLQTTNSPILKLVKAIASKLGEDYGSIEETLQTIYEQYDGLAEAADFTLSDTQIQALENAQHFIELATASIIAASQEDSFGSPWPYNKTINEWNRAHKAQLEEKIEDLPEISQDLANVTLGGLMMYSQEIDSWLKKAKSNRINKVKMFKEFDTKFEEVKLRFFMDNKEKWITEDGVNLLEGFQEKATPKDSVLEAERTLYKNAQKLIKEGKNISVIFEAIKDSINWEQAATQKTSKLDVNLTELTDYDKFVYFISCIGLNPDNFYTEYKKFVEQNKESIAPLSFQKHNIRIEKALENNPKLFNQFLDLFKQQTKLNCPILYNTVITTGIGGAGKSSVCGKALINKDSWIVGPTDTQINNLKELASDLTSYTTSKLLKLILEDQYDEKTGIDKELITETSSNDGGRADISKLNIKPFDKAPSNIILDEATLSSNATLQAISKWSKINGVILNLIGDENQNGNSNPGNNIARETIIAIRTPKMQLSLRDGNLWKYQNQQTLMNLEDQLRDTVTKEETQVVRDKLQSTDLPKFELKYYFKEGTLTGDMITAEVTDEQIKALVGKVKFIGSENSPIYQKLKTAGKVDRAYSLEEIQGQESAYIVADVDWKSLYKPDGNAFDLLNFMRNLYTVITRSKQGSIIIDNGLSGIIKGGSPQSYTTDSVIINKDAIKEFSNYELEWLNSLTLNPTGDNIQVQRNIDPQKEIVAILPDNEIENNDSIRNEDQYEIENIGESIPIQIYTNFNYLGINRDSKSTEWYNEDDSRRDVGIFLKKGKKASTNDQKRKYANLLFDLKSYIIYDDIPLYNSTASNQLKKEISKENLEGIKYFVVKESYDSQVHHLISEEQGLEELPDGETIYTLQARFKNKSNEDCVITLGILPKSTNLHEEIIEDSINKKIAKLQESTGNESEIARLQQLLQQVNDGTVAKNYQQDLNDILNLENQELEIDKPNFTQICGLGRIRSIVIDKETGEKKVVRHKIRLSEVNSNKSRFNARSSNYVVSPIYVSMDSTDPLIKQVVNGKEVEVPTAGKPCIFVTGRRIYKASELAELYEKQLSEGTPLSIRKIYLDSAGVSFESLFDQRYADTFKSGSKDNSYTFPFDLLPTGVRMYTALHNFRAYLTKLMAAIDAKFGKDLIALEKILQEESRLYLQFKGDKEVIPSELDFKQWVESNKNLIQNGITFEQIQSIWEFNDTDLKDVKQFRIGYNQENGVYVRNISEGYLGNYINPQVAKQYLGTVEELFKVVIDRIIPRNSINPNDLVDYRITEEMFKDLEKNWVEHIENSGNLLLNIVEGDKVVPINIGSKDILKGLPLVLTLITRNIQARQRMNDPDALFKGYDVADSDSPYTVKLGDTILPYLDILKGGLGDVRKGRAVEPGIIEAKGGQKNTDLRLLNMFNIAFHGTVATGGNDFLSKIHLKEDGTVASEGETFVKTVDRMHANDVLFPFGIFVDPILGGKFNEHSKYRIVATNPKYYLTNISPSGAKTFITLKGKEKEKKKSVVETEEEKTTVNEFHQKLNNIAGKEIDITESVVDEQELVKLTNEILSDKMSIRFSASGRFDSPEDFLNMTSFVSLNEDGTLSEIKIKDYEEFKTVDKLVSIKKESNGYTLISSDGKIFDVTFQDKIIINPRTQRDSTEFNWTIKDAISALEGIETFKNYDTIMKESEKVSKKAYNTYDSFETAFNKFIKKLKDEELTQEVDNQRLLDRIKNNEC